MNNIAEGFERRRQDSNIEFKRFLWYAKDSGGEVRSMLYVAFDCDYIDKEQFKNLRNRTKEISSVIVGFMKII